MNCVLIKMGGKGVRFGNALPKQFYELDGEPLFAYVLRKYNDIKNIDSFIIVTNNEWMDMTISYAQDILGSKLLSVVPGGDTNAKSTYNGVMAATEFLKDDDILLVHDVTDAIISEKAINSAINACKVHKCIAVVTEQVHTLYKKNNEGFITGTIEKQTVGSGYSPEAFEYAVIKSSFESASETELNQMTSAMALVQAHGYMPFCVVSHQIDIKITYQEDMEALKLVIKNGENLYKSINE
ncbi:MAG: 2-C-methyl-D-erythritol 4-phosphate cytidylyltransferase [Firmicutes bacterium]|nr:2-C-methyl-D-erythritol 4-phosphate cytidylyltransferase [Bacillota bacterium]